MENIFIIILVLLLAGFAVALWQSNKNMVKNTTTDKEETKNSEALSTTGANNKNSSGEMVTYYKDIEGFYVEPESTNANTPGVVMMHEWWGLNDNIKDMARELAKQGYRVLAVNLYGVPATTDRAEAQRLTSRTTKAETTANMRAAVELLRSKGSSKIASLGWCYGGGKSLELALSGEKLNGVVIYYGTPLVTDKNELVKIPAPVLGIFGREDTAIPVEQVEQFQAGLVMNDIKNQIVIYPGVGHAFANPSGANYAPEATRDAWDKTLAFLKTNLSH